MRLIGSASIGIVLLAGTASAATWSLLSFSTTPENASKVVSAADKLMNSEVGKEFPGRILLQSFTANGDDAATHCFVPIYKTAAERETFVQKLQDAPAWTEFQKTMADASEPASQTLLRTVKSWGDIVDTDQVWMAHSFEVDDPRAFVQALDGMMASPTGKQFPGQAYLSEVIAGGLNKVTHVISVGYASEAEMADWQRSRNASNDWATYLTASRKSAEYLGATLARDVKSWGPATLKEVTATS